MSDQITTIAFYHYHTFRQKAWAFQMMQYAHPLLKDIPGMTFYKLMGSGKDLDFRPYPDWSTYAILQIWDHEDDANRFFEQHRLAKKYKTHSTNHWVIYMKHLRSHGLWSGSNPFEVSDSLDPDNEHVAVITRATIRKRKLFSFWRYVPTSQKPISSETPGLIYTKGIGEVPVLHMATFSIWSNQNDLDNFAYQTREHQVAIQKTRKLDWYKEEMFTRFQPYKTIGNLKKEIALPF